MSRTQVIWKNLRSRWNICVIGYSLSLSHFQDLLGAAPKILIFVQLGLLDLTFDEEFLTFINMWHSSVSVLLSHHHGCLYFPASDIMALSSSSAQTCLWVGVVVVGVELCCPPGPSHSWHWSITEPSSTTTTLPDSHSAQKVFVIVILVSIIIGILVTLKSYILICIFCLSLCAAPRGLKL